MYATFQLLDSKFPVILFFLQSFKLTAIILISLDNLSIATYETATENVNLLLLIVIVLDSLLQVIVQIIQLQELIYRVSVQEILKSFKLCIIKKSVFVLSIKAFLLVNQERHYSFIINIRCAQSLSFEERYDFSCNVTHLL